jgi:hypothetical protein
MKTITCYYDDKDHSGKAWDQAVEKALSELPIEERASTQVICLPESFRGERDKWTK